ncbi:MAG: hypothetical protein Q9179_002857 [Wetmoreana sp. 5 TL-2023]
MSALLWKSFLEHDVVQFRDLLANASFTSAGHSRAGVAGTGGLYGASTASPGTSLGTSPTLTHKDKRAASGGFYGFTSAKGTKQSPSLVLTRADINCKDSSGCTLLHLIASSTSEDAICFAIALLDVPLLDLYVQDAESGWTALHRALYFGNIAIARALLDRDLRDAVGSMNVGTSRNAVGLLKVKDREGNSPFDVYGASIASRIIRPDTRIPLLSGSIDDDDNPLAYSNSDVSSEGESQSKIIQPSICVDGDELFTFGSNKNFTLGFANEDDRQFPERIYFNRSERLLHRLTNEHSSRLCPAKKPPPNQGSPDAVPAVIQHRRITIQDVRLAKLHSAVLTNDPEANLYICGFGPGGRLGTGDETTRFNFVPVCAGGLATRKVIDIGLGQNHTVAVTSKGEVFSWGNNSFGQLGYASSSSTTRDEDILQLIPRQVFGPLKREMAQGTAASRLHSVVFTSNSLYTFGKNEGQLGLVDSDARSLILKNTPRRVAASLFSSAINNVSAIDKATVCLLDNHDVWIFANYGYTKLTFPLDSSQDFLKNHFLTTRYNSVPNHICKITSGGDTVCAMSNEGDVFTVKVSHGVEAAPGNGSTTNPAKIRGALSAPQRIWTRKKGHMAVRDVDVGQDSSVIICTDAGSVWRRSKRAKVKDANAPLTTTYKPKDYKFTRVPGLTRIIAVRSNIFGAYAAIRGDCDVLQTQVTIDHQRLWKDLHPLLPFKDFSLEEDSETETPRPRFWTPSLPKSDTSAILQAVYYADNLEQSIADLLAERRYAEGLTYEVHIGTTTSEVHLPLHEFILSGRSTVLRRALSTFRKEYFFAIPKILTIEYDKDGQVLLLFENVDFLTVFNFVLYVYTDAVAEVWLQTRNPSRIVSRYRQVRNELMQIAAHLDMRHLEQSVRVQSQPTKTLHEDMDRAIAEPDYFQHADVNIQLDGASLKAHSPILCQRCPFFEGLFQGRAAGRWLSTRRQQSQESVAVDFKHVDPRVFKLVRRYIYADTGEELFDQIRCPDLESFLDLILEVMSVANELMLDRLSQCCQKVLGRYVDTRNVCQLLNVVASCSVTEFKRAALEYICLNLEGMLENHLLNDLDQDLLLELDHTVRQNQLARLPITRSGRAEAELLQTNPHLAGIIERGKRTKIDRIAFQSRWRYDDLVARSTMARASATDNDEGPNKAAILLKQTRKASHDQISQGKSPHLNPKQSTADLMFDMDISEESPSQEPTNQTSEEAVDDSSAIEARHEISKASSSLLAESPWLGVKGKELGTGIASSTSPFALNEYSVQSAAEAPSPTGNFSDHYAFKPWGSHGTSSQKLDMKEIMAQATANRISSISAGFSSSTSKVTSTSDSIPGRLTQRERKKQQQRAALNQTPDALPPQVIEPQAGVIHQRSPWQVASRGAKTSLKEILDADAQTPSPSRGTPGRAISNPPLTLRQTIPGNVSSAKRTTSEGSSTTHPVPSQRSTSTPNISTSPQPSSSRAIPSPAAIRLTSSTTIKSIRHNPSPHIAAPEPSLQLSMADILSQQQTEKDVIKEAVAKRSLHEIQEEQAFQEWWDQESRKVREEEEATKAAAMGKHEGRSRGRGRGRGDSKGRGKGKTGKSGEGNGESSTVSPSRSKARKDVGKGVRGMDRGRGAKSS